MNLDKEQIFYKYREIGEEGSTALRYLKEILEQKRLYAAKRASLNDPMEGVYHLLKDEGSYHRENQRRRADKDYLYKIFETMEQIREKKFEYNICSLSETKDSLLMWSHYANSCMGIVIGVNVNDSYFKDNSINKINYNETLISLPFENALEYYNDKVKTILNSKLADWKYEKEVRVLTRKDYIDVEIDCIIFGHKVCEDDKEIVLGLLNEYGLDDVRIENETLQNLENIDGNKILQLQDDMKQDVFQ